MKKNICITLFAILGYVVPVSGVIYCYLQHYNVCALMFIFCLVWIVTQSEIVKYWVHRAYTIERTSAEEIDKLKWEKEKEYNEFSNSTNAILNSLKEIYTRLGTNTITPSPTTDEKAEIMDVPKKKRGRKPKAAKIAEEAKADNEPIDQTLFPNVHDEGESTKDNGGDYQ